MNATSFSDCTLMNTVKYNSHLGSKITLSEVQDQKKSYLCWAFAICTMLKSELRLLIVKLFNCNRIAKSTKQNLLKMVEILNVNRNLQSELVLLVSPRNPKVSSCDFTNSKKQAANFLNVIDKLCYPSIVKDEGWRRMPSIMKIFDILGLDGLF